MNRLRILIAGVDKKMAKHLRGYLEKANFDASILRIGDSVVSKVRINPPDAILLDVDPHSKEGMAICREIRSFSDVPILMLTAKLEDMDLLLCTDLGLIVYICKPFKPKEVVRRIKVELQRRNNKPKEKILKLGLIVIDGNEHRITISDIDLHATDSEFEMLKVMVSRPDCIFTRRELSEKIYGHDSNGYHRRIDKHITNLRKKINDISPGNKIIQTVHGIGYSICAS